MNLTRDGCWIMLYINKMINEIVIGDFAKCTRDIIGQIKSIKKVAGRIMFFGKTVDGKNWQSVRPVKIN